MAFYEGRFFVLTLRIIQAVLTILILGLTGYGRLLVAAIFDGERTRLTNTRSLQLVERLLARRCALASQLPLVLRCHHLDHSRLPDRCTVALYGDQAQPCRHHHGSRGPDHGLLVRRVCCARCLLGR